MESLSIRILAGIILLYKRLNCLSQLKYTKDVTRSHMNLKSVMGIICHCSVVSRSKYTI